MSLPHDWSKSIVRAERAVAEASSKLSKNEQRTGPAPLVGYSSAMDRAGEAEFTGPLHLYKQCAASQY